MFSMLSFIVSFPTSEAVVESWGSSIDHLNKTKPHTKEVLDVSDTGTIDKMVFIKLNGPPPGFRKKHKRILKSALLLMFNGDFSSHFTHSGQKLTKTSLVVSKIHNTEIDIWPRFND